MDSVEGVVGWQCDLFGHCVHELSLIATAPPTFSTMSLAIFDINMHFMSAGRLGLDRDRPSETGLWYVPRRRSCSQTRELLMVFKGLSDGVLLLTIEVCIGALPDIGLFASLPFLT